MTTEQKNELYDLMGNGEEIVNELRNAHKGWKDLDAAMDLIQGYMDAQTSVRDYVAAL